MIALTGINIFAQEAGKIMSILGSNDGSVQLLANEKAQSGKVLKEKDIIHFGDVLIAKDVMVKIILTHYDDEPLVVMKPNTKIRLEKKEKYKKGGIFAFFGKLFFKGNGTDHRGFKIVTSNAIAGIEGTEFELEYDPKKKKTVIKVIHGIIEALLRKGFPGLKQTSSKKMLSAGDTATITNKGFGAVFEKDRKKLNDAEIKGIRDEWAINAKAINEKEEIQENFKTDGNVRVLLKLVCEDENGVTSLLPVKARILFENSWNLNGKKLKYTKTGVWLYKLVDGASYALSIRVNGVDYDVDIDIDKSRKEEIIKYRVASIKLELPNDLVNSYQIFKKDFLINIDGNKCVSSYRGLNITDPDVLYFDTKGRKVLISFYMPFVDYIEPVTMELEYTGSIDVKEKKMRFIIDGEKNKYEYTLK